MACKICELKAVLIFFFFLTMEMSRRKGHEKGLYFASKIAEGFHGNLKKKEKCKLERRMKEGGVQLLMFCLDIVRK
jgi:hypothetical protein